MSGIIQQANCNLRCFWKIELEEVRYYDKKPENRKGNHKDKRTACHHTGKVKEPGRRKTYGGKSRKLDIIEKHKISSEKLQLLIKFSEDEILQLLAQKEKERTGNEEKVIS